MSKLRPEALTWTALLAKWMDYARATLALPDDADGMRWRSSVAPIITLQAVTFALGDIDPLPADEQALARDKAELLIDRAQHDLATVWNDAGWPDNVRDIVDDARAALLRVTRQASGDTSAVTELIWPGPGAFTMPDVDLPNTALERGTLSVMMPGTIVMPDEPVAWWRGHPGLTVDGCAPRPSRQPRQVYRQLDEHGRIARDYIAPIADELPPGMPLLVPLLADGERIGRFTMERETWLENQRAALAGRETIPVERAP